MSPENQGVISQGYEGSIYNMTSVYNWTDNVTAVTAGVRYPQPPPPWWKLLVMYSVGIAILTVNIPVFIILLKKRVPALQRSMKYTMFSLACSDFLLGCECWLRLLKFLGSRDYYLDHSFCRWDGFLNNFLASVSILSLTFLSLDKLLIVKYPMRHKDLMIKRRIILFLLMIWGTMFFLYSPTFFSDQGSNFDQDAYICIGVALNMYHGILIVILVHVFPSITIVTCFISIYCLVRKSQSFRRKASTSTYSASQEDYARRLHKDNMQMIKTLVIMSSGYYIMWVPFFVTMPYWELFSGSSLHPLSDFITCWLGAANSMVNPLIYIPTLRPYRHALYALIGKKKTSSTSKEGEFSGIGSGGIPVQYSKVEAGDPFSSNSH